MAWTEQCKINAVAQVEHLKKREQISTSKAIKALSVEAEIPTKTIEKWVYPKIGEDLGKKCRKLEAALKLLTEQYEALQNKSSSKVSLPTLYVGKAEDLHFIEDESIDIIFTSPPYNLQSEDWPMGGQGREVRVAGIGYEDDRPEDEYQKWQLAVFDELFRVAKPGASFFCVHKVRQNKGGIIHPLDWIRHKDNPWTLRQELIWDRKSTLNHCKSLFWQHDERIYWMTKGKPALASRAIGLPTIFEIFGPSPNTWHPAPFCEELPMTILKAIAPMGAVVLDPFGGSMTTCKVALELGLEAIGVDASKKYVNKAAKEHGWTIS